MLSEEKILPREKTGVLPTGGRLTLYMKRLAQYPVSGFMEFSTKSLNNPNFELKAMGIRKNG
ncbi:MAG TPA: hypothetical protein DD706_17000 [Nitrospiraceae bacterium]|nr:hypothetical protein [Nitrospiraceae bacterium]